MVPHRLHILVMLLLSSADFLKVNIFIKNLSGTLSECQTICIHLVTIDNKLLFREHISKKSAIANRNLGIIFKSFTYLGKEMFLCLYEFLIQPHVEYATAVWSLMYKKDEAVLENIQRPATRMVN